MSGNKKFIYCLIAALFPFFAFIQMNLLNVLGPKLNEALSITSQQIGMLSAIYIYASACMLFPVGMLLDRFSIKNVLSLGIILTTLGVLCLSTANTFFQSMVGRLIAGSGHAFALLSCFRFITLYLPIYRQGLMSGLILTIALMGGLVAQFPLVWLSDKMDWQKTLYLQVCLGIFIFFLIYFLVPNLANPSRKNLSHHIPKQELKKVCQSIKNWLAGFYGWFTYVPLMIFGALLGVNYLVAMHHLTDIEASFVTSMIFIGTMVGFPLFGFISDLLKERYFLMILCPLIAASLIVWLYLGGQFSNQSLTIIFFLIGLFTSTSGLVYPIIAENNLNYITSTAMGITNIIIMAGSASSQLLFSYMWENMLKIYALYAIPVLLIISSVFAISMRKKSNIAVYLPLQRFNQVLDN